jgi:sulfatase modifying factor 1
MTAKPWFHAPLLLVLVAVQASAAEPTLTIPLGDGVELELVLVPKGKFQQGSPADEKGRGDDETPRQVSISRDFYMGKYPVTRGQFARFVQDTGYRTEAERGKSGGFGWDGSKLVQRKDFTWRQPGFPQTDEHPVTIVTYADARAFADWLAKKAKRTIALPTEAQWEYACRAGSTTRFYHGDKDENLGDIAWFKANAGNGTRPVGKKKANAFGLSDMAGNVYEWCSDWYGPYEDGPVTDPEERRDDRTDPPRRVLRGGSWLKDAPYCRSAARYRNTPGSRNADNGFRLTAATEVAKGAVPPDKVPPDEAPAKADVPLPLPAPDDFPLHVQEETPPSFVAAGGAAGLLCLLAVGAVIIGAVIVILKGLRGTDQGMATARRRPDVQIRPAVDGFWISAAGLRAGSTIRYRYVAGGMDQIGEVPYQPGPQGQFVYTGGTPTDVRVLEVVAPDDFSSGPGPGMRMGWPQGPSHFRSSPPPRPGPSTGYPSAY